MKRTTVIKIKKGAEKAFAFTKNTSIAFAGSIVENLTFNKKGKWRQKR